MNYQKNPLLLAALVLFYFGVAWFFPWEMFQPRATTISISYLWDILFVAVTSFLYQLHLRKRNWTKSFKGTLTRSFAIFLLATVSVLFLRMTSYPSPFRYLEMPVLQLLILAPLLEELIFRHAFLGGLLKTGASENKALLISSFLFSISHLPGIWHLPAEFRPFIVIQLSYTFAMGWVIGKARTRTEGVFEPILLHFLFNLCFYFAMTREWI